MFASLGISDGRIFCSKRMLDCSAAAGSITTFCAPCLWDVELGALEGADGPQTRYHEGD